MAKKTAICTAIVLAAIVLTHLPAYFAFFVSDDFVLIEHTHEQPAAKFWDGADRAGFAQYQPLTLSSFVWSYNSFGLNQRGYHLVNLGGLLLATLGLLLLARRLIGSWAGAAATAALFGLHPLTAAAVGFISDRGRLFAAALALVCLACATWAIELSRRSRGAAWGLAWLAALCAAGAVLCSPEALWLALMLPLLALLPQSDENAVEPRNLLWVAPAALLVAALGLGLGSLVQGPAGLFDLHLRPGLYVLRNLARAVQLCVLPLRIEGALEFAVAWQFLLFPLALLAAAAGFWFAARWAGSRPLIGAAGLLLFGFTPVMCEEPRLGLLIVPAAGICLAAGALFDRAWHSVRLQRVALVALVALGLAAAAGSVGESLGWLRAGALSKQTVMALVHGSGKTDQPRQAYALSVPDNLDGRFVMRNGVFQACRLFHGPRNLYVERWLSVGLDREGRGALRVERPLPTRFVVSALPPTRYLLLPDGSRAHKQGDEVQLGGVTYQLLELGHPFSPTKVQLDVPPQWLLEQSPDLYLFSDGALRRLED
ncbi:MAG: hypothetical protein P9M14_06930 [Candidatus Alcyoniella australis]|nr:hypothetical protein [Candidatus Alcyoniella australis]